MSLQFLPEKEESIYNLIPRPREKVVKPDRYQSKFRKVIKEEKKMNKTDSKTMGPANVRTNNPENFMKKRSKLPRLPAKKDFKYPDEEKRKPNVPKQSDAPVSGVKSNKNFINSNAVENIMSVPKQPACNYVDSKDGTIHNLETSGRTPCYTKKKEYGKTPAYLSKRKETDSQMQRQYEAYIQNYMRQGQMKCLSQGERENILAGLKSNWEELHHQYQGLSVVTDTAPKKTRKERMEAEMNELEKEIECLEKHKNIYIMS